MPRGDYMIIKGDLNGDGRVDWTDNALAEGVLYGIIQLTEEQLIAGDINGDGVFDYEDASAIKEHCQSYKMITEVIE